MSIDKLNIRFNEPIYDQENIDKLKNKVNEIVDEVGEIEEETIPKTKKLYCHPITIINDGTLKYRLTALIFNNSNEPFTLTSLKTWLDNLASATENKGKLMISGGAYNTTNEVLLICSHVYYTGSAYAIVGLDLTGSGQSIVFTNFNSLFPATTTLEDGVNEVYPNISE